MDLNTLSQKIIEAKNAGASKEDMEKFAEYYRVLKAEQSKTLGNDVKQDVGGFQGVVQEMAKPFLKTTAAVSMAAGVPIARLLGAKEEDIQKTVVNGIDYGYFGTVHPAGSQVWTDEAIATQPGTKERAKVGLQVLGDITGTALETVSYAFSPLKTGAPTSFFKTVLNPKTLKTVAPFAAPFAIGKGLQIASEEDGSISQGIVEGLGSYAGAAIGFNLLNGGGVLLSNWGARAMKNPVVKALSEKLTDFASKARDWVSASSRQKLGEALDFGTVQFKQEVDNTILGLSDEIMRSYRVNTPNQQQLFQGTQNSMRTYIGQQYKVKEDLFSNFLGDETVKVSETNFLDEAINKAKNLLKIKGGDTSIPTGSKLSAEEYRKFANIQAIQESDESIGLIQGYINGLEQMKQKGGFSMRDGYNLYGAADDYISKNDGANKVIRDMAFAVFDDMESAIAKQNPRLQPQWQAARDYARQISQNIDTTYANRLTSAASINNFVDDMLSGRAPARETMKGFVNAFKTQEEKQIMSQMFFNEILDEAMVRTSPNEKAEVINGAIKWLAKYGDDSIMQPGHISQLQNVSDIVNTRFSDFLVNAQKLGQGGGTQMVDKINSAIEKQVAYNFLNRLSTKTNGFRDYSMLGENISKITSVEELNAILSVVDDPEISSIIGKEIVRGIAERNSSIIAPTGKITEDTIRGQVSGIFKDLNRIGGSNKREIFNKLFGNTEVKFTTGQTQKLSEYLLESSEILNSLGRVEGMTGTTLLKAAHLTAGLLYGFTGRMVPGTYHLSQFARASASSTKTVDLIGLMTQLSNDGYLLKPNMRKRLGDFMMEKTQNLNVPTAVSGYTLDEIFNVASEMTGMELLPEDKKALQDEINNR